MSGCEPQIWCHDVGSFTTPSASLFACEQLHWFYYTWRVYCVWTRRLYTYIRLDVWSSYRVSICSSMYCVIITKMSRRGYINIVDDTSWYRVVARRHYWFHWETCIWTSLVTYNIKNHELFMFMLTYVLRLLPAYRTRHNYVLPAYRTWHTSCLRIEHDLCLACVSNMPYMSCLRIEHDIVCLACVSNGNSFNSMNSMNVPLTLLFWHTDARPLASKMSECHTVSFGSPIALAMNSWGVQYFSQSIVSFCCSNHFKRTQT